MLVKDGTIHGMQPELAIGLASTAVAAIAIAASTTSTLLSLRSQQENTKATLEAQRLLASFQEKALRERSHDQELRDKRATIYLALLRWTEQLLSALDEIVESTPTLPQHKWHISEEIEDLADLYASDPAHTRFNALRGFLFGLLEGPEQRSKIVTWDETDGKIESLEITDGSLLSDWPSREATRDQAVEMALDLVHVIREETQGQRHSGYFVTFRLPRQRRSGDDSQQAR